MGCQFGVPGGTYPPKKYPSTPPGLPPPILPQTVKSVFLVGLICQNTLLLVTHPFLRQCLFSVASSFFSGFLNLFCRLRYSTPFCPLKIFSRSPASPPRLVQLVVTPVLLSCPQKKSITSQLFWRKLISLKLVPDQNPRPKRSIRLPPGQRRSYQ